jgi:glycerate dehydrogenase
VKGKERVVFLDRAAFCADDLPMPAFDHNWSEYPSTAPADLVPRLFWATTAITHACSLDAEVLGQLHKLRRIVVTGPATVDPVARAANGPLVHRLPASDAPAQALIEMLETLVEEAEG